MVLDGTYAAIVNPKNVEIIVKRVKIKSSPTNYSEFVEVGFYQTPRASDYHTSLLVFYVF